MPLQHAVEDQVVQGDRRLERIAEDVVEVEPAEPLRLGKAVRVDQHHGAQGLGSLPERGIGRV
ncbi:MAG: hypothetical protein WDN49_02280 [Acetobacteraceae bacterium]